MTVAPKGSEIYTERATTVTIQDESGGEFVEVEQHGNGRGKIAIDPEEWPALRSAIDTLIGECRG